jgi:hypothetical protein
MLDTLKIAKRLEAANLPAEQAEAIVSALAEVASSEFATKADLQGLETRLSDKIIGVRIDVIDRIESVTDRIDTVRDRVTWVIVGVSGLTWLLQLFGTNLKHFFGF